MSGGRGGFFPGVWVCGRRAENSRSGSCIREAYELVGLCNFCLFLEDPATANHHHRSTHILCRGLTLDPVLVSMIACVSEISLPSTRSRLGDSGPSGPRLCGQAQVLNHGEAPSPPSPEIKEVVPCHGPSVVGPQQMPKLEAGIAEEISEIRMTTG